MAKRIPKERPYHCRLCSIPLAEDEVGFVCQHVAHESMLTVIPDAPKNGELLPDTACTSCCFAMDANKKNAEEDAQVHVVCEPCYADARDRHIDYFTEDDEKQGYVLVQRSHYDRLAPRKKTLSIGTMAEGRMLKLGFSPIPCTHPISLERMWVRVTCVLEGGELHGMLANTPTLFKRKVLKSNDNVVFSAEHVLEIEDDKAISKRPAAIQKKKAAKKKAAVTKLKGISTAAPKRSAAKKKAARR